MNILIIDGNSIVNRAFYGIKLLTAKDGHFTNAIYGFLNILINLHEYTKAESIIVAFDVHEPTFRHKMYSEYKAGRKGMPPELREQIEPLKKILTAYGCRILECPGYEADDILGTVSHNCRENDKCFIATGDRDSLQLVRDNVSVLLTTTKMGKTQTVEYTPEILFDEYGLTPEQMIELKALQGDSSDNIPGVPGVGPKTAGDIIKKYGSIENVYEKINEIEVTENVRNKLINGKESAFLSKKLGTISFEAPVDVNVENYASVNRNDSELLTELGKHELFKVISKLGLKAGTSEKKANEPVKQSAFRLCDFSDFNKSKLDSCKEIYITAVFDAGELKQLTVCADCQVFTAENPDAEILLNAVYESGANTVVYQTKELTKFLLKNSIKPKMPSFDVGLAAYLLDANASDYTVSSIALSYNLTCPGIENTDKLNELEKQEVQNTVLLQLLKQRLKSVIEDNGQMKLLTEIEIPLAQVLASMELEGMLVNRSEIENYSVVLSEKINGLEKEIYDECGEVFNINSPKQLSTVLFEKLNIPAKKKTKSGYSTNAEVLEELAVNYPVVSKILQYRTYAKLKGTYCDGLLKAIAGDGRIHSTFNQTETRTGRLSSTEPNLQNIPVRTEVGKEFRKFFCAREGYEIVDADYSQIELRVLASLSADENMINAFNSGEDIHRVTASKVFNTPVNEVTEELRSKAKAVNFGIVYGIGAFSLAKDIKSSRKEAENFINAYLALYGSVDAYMKNSITKGRENGYVATLFNRRRYLPELTSSNGMIRSFGERVARNMPIQGTAADIIKIAMIRVTERLSEELPEARLIMQVHDELIIEAPAEDSAKAAEILREEMENAVKLPVRLSVDVGVGKNWYEAKS